MKTHKFNYPAVVRKIGYNPALGGPEYSGYYLCADGNIWYVPGVSISRSNCGTYEEMIKSFRITLLDQKEV
jgi:hypothetical protein